MAALIRAAREPDFPADIAVVVSNKPDAAGLDFAKSSAIATEVVASRAYSSRVAFEVALDARLRAHNIDVVCLAGFMRVLGETFVETWRGRLLNIHPSLLPAYKGLDTHARALADGAHEHGCSVHLVVPELDAGPILAQARVPVLPGDDPASLAARVLEAEHRLYPSALADFICALDEGGEYKHDLRSNGPA